MGVGSTGVGAVIAEEGGGVAVDAVGVAVAVAAAAA